MEVVKTEALAVQQGMRREAKLGFLIAEEQEAPDLDRGQPTVVMEDKLDRAVVYPRVMMDRGSTVRMQQVEQLELR